MGQLRTSCEKFNYDGLRLASDRSQLRLVRVLPAANISDEVQCQIAIASVDEIPVYEALPYAWGDATVTAPIELEGREFDVATN